MNEKLEPNQETDSVSSAAENSIWLSDALNRKSEPANLNESPKQKISLIRAFKERSRIIRQIDLISRQIREDNSIIEGGLRSIDEMERMLNETNIQFLSLSRPLLREPDLPSKLQSGESTESKCISCNRCYSSPCHRCVFRK